MIADVHVGGVAKSPQADFGAAKTAAAAFATAFSPMSRTKVLYSVDRRGLAMGMSAVSAVPNSTLTRVSIVS